MSAFGVRAQMEALEKLADYDSALASADVFALVSLLCTLAILVINSPFILLALPPLGMAYVYPSSYYRNSAREVQRLDSISKSPIYTSFAEALNGASSIQAFATDLSLFFETEITLPVTKHGMEPEMAPKEVPVATFVEHVHNVQMQANVTVNNNSSNKTIIIPGPGAATLAPRRVVR